MTFVFREAGHERSDVLLIRPARTMAITLMGKTAVRTWGITLVVKTAG
jgi:hypothetical protein